ncbi:MAG: methyltransferase [Anaerolineales bacterium]|jgi:protein-S-isoprenylcysteine O-methyltransferase Ste14
MFWLFISVLLWGSVHSLLASLKAKELFQGWLGTKFMRFYRLAYNAFAGISFLPVLALVVLTKSRILYIVPLPWSGLMILGEILAVAGLLIGFLQTDAWEFLGLRQLEGSARPSQLKTKGLYHFVRHPLYSTGLALIWLFPIMTYTILVIDIALTIYILIGASFEERKLRREFGKEYIDYAAETPMLVPYFRSKRT